MSRYLDELQIVDEMYSADSLYDLGDSTDEMNHLRRDIPKLFQDRYEEDEDAQIEARAIQERLKPYETINQFIDAQPRIGERDNAFEFAIDKFQKNLGAGIQTLGDLFGSDTLREVGASYVEKQLNEIRQGGYQAKFNKNFTETDGFFNKLGWVGERIAENWADVGFTLAGGVAGAGAKLALRGAVAAGGKKGAAAKFASRTPIGVTGTVAVGSSIGEVRTELEEKGVYDPDDAITAAGVGLVIGLLDTITGSAASAAPIIKQYVEDGTAKALGRSALQYAKTAGNRAAGEAITEAIQELGVIGAAAFEGAEYEIGEVANRLLESAIVGGALGASVPAVGDAGRAIFEGNQSKQDEGIIDDGSDSQEIEKAVEREPSVSEVVPPTERDQRSRQDYINIRQERIDRNLRDDEIDVDAVKVGLNEDPRVYNSENHKDNVLIEYAASFKGETNYEKAKEATVSATKEEIRSILDETGLDIVVSTDSVSDDKDVADSNAFGKNIIEVQRSDRDGLLSEIVPEQSYTYGEALQAIHKLYGKTVVATDRNEIGERLAADATISMFSKEAEPVVATQVISGKDAPFIIRRRSKEQLIITKDESVYNALERGDTILDKDREAPKSSTDNAIESLIQQDFRIGEKIAKKAGYVGDKVAGLDRREGDAKRVTPKTKRNIIDVLEQGVFVGTKRDLADGLRIQASLEGTHLNEIGTKLKAAKKAIKLEVTGKKYNFRKKGKERQEALEGMLYDLLRGDVSLVTTDNKVGRATSNSVYVDDDGNVLFRHKDQSIHKLPKEFAEPFIELQAVTNKYQSYVLSYIENELSLAQEKITNSQKYVRQKIEELDAAIQAEGTTAEYKMFSANEKTRNDWKAKALYEGDDISILHQGARMHMEDIAATRYDTQVEQVEEIQRLNALFQAALSEAKSIDDFVTITQGEFGGKDNLDISMQAVLGRFNQENTKEILRQITSEKIMVRRLRETERLARTIQSNPFYLHRQYYSYYDDKWLDGMKKPRTKEQIERKEAYKNELIKDYKDSAEESGKKLTDERAADMADQTINKLVNDIDNEKGEQGASMLRTSHVLDKRQDLSDAKRAFMGEVTDPVEAIGFTLNALNNEIIHRNHVNILWQREGDGLYTSIEHAEQNGIDPATLFEVTVPRNTASVLQGEDAAKTTKFSQSNVRDAKVFVTGPMKAAIDQFKPVKPFDSVWARAAQQYTLAFKMYHTVFDYALGTMNIIGGISSLAMGGYAQALLGRKDTDVNFFNGAKAVSQWVRNKPVTNPEWKEAIQKIVGSEISAEEVMGNKALAKDFISQAMGTIGAIHPKGRQVAEVGQKIWEAPQKVGIEYYRFGDLFVKAMLYQTYKTNLTKIKPKNASQDSIDSLARDFAINTGFDMSQVSSLVKDLSLRTPFLGSFLSHQTVQWSALSHGLKNIAKVRQLEAMKYGEENISDFDPQNPEHMKLANEQVKNFAGHHPISTKMFGQYIVGFGMMPAAMGTMVAGLGHLIGEEDDPYDIYGEDGVTTQAMRALLPEYYKNATIGIYDKDSKGNIGWVDVSRLSNYGQFHEGWNALFNSANPDASIDERVSEAMGAMFGGYFTEAFGLQAWNAIRNNETQFGQQIYNPEDATSMVTDTIKYLANQTVGAGSVGDAFKGVQSIWAEDEYNQYTGQPRKDWNNVMLEYAGIRVKTFDPSHQLSSRAWEQKNRLSDAKKFARSRMKSFNKNSKSDTTSHMMEIKAVHDSVFEEMLVKVEAARAIGLTDKQIQASLKGKFNKNYVKSLLVGVRPSLDISKFGTGSTSSTSVRQIEQGARDNFEENFKTAREIYNNLP